MNYTSDKEILENEEKFIFRLMKAAYKAGYDAHEQDYLAGSDPGYEKSEGFDSWYSENRKDINKVRPHGICGLE